jgi:hypothetical protein
MLSTPLVGLGLAVFVLCAENGARAEAAEGKNRKNRGLEKKGTWPKKKEGMAEKEGVLARGGAVTALKDCIIDLSSLDASECASIMCERNIDAATAYFQASCEGDFAALAGQNEMGPELVQKWSSSTWASPSGEQLSASTLTVVALLSGLASFILGVVAGIRKYGNGAAWRMP